MISVLALTASLAHAGSCGDQCGGDKDKKGEKTGLTTTSITVACDKTCDGDKKKGEKASLAESVVEMACDKTCDGDKKKSGETKYSASIEALV